MHSLRDDRFYCSVPIVNEGHFRQTSFLKLYNQIEKNPSKDTVISSLQNLQNETKDFTDVIKELNKASNNSDVIRLYTSDIFIGRQRFYAYINQQLCNDNQRTLRQLMPFIRRATSQINFHAPHTMCTVYRIMDLDDKQRAFFKIGIKFRFPGFTSTSKMRNPPRIYGNTVFEIEVDANCLQVRDISNISHYPREQEYLFSPYSLFEVIDTYDDTIVLKSHDNKSESHMNPVNNAIPKQKPVSKPIKHSSVSSKNTSDPLDQFVFCYNSICFI